MRATKMISRRQRAMHTALLHELRGIVLAPACERDRLAREVYVEDASVVGRPIDVSDRAVRARLALYLRALLRADHGDFGPWLCKICGRTGIHRNYGRDRWYCGDDAEDFHYFREGSRRVVRPLWESARKATK